MSQIRSPSLGRCYGMVRVARVWNISRASIYRSRKEMPPNTSGRRPGPGGACSDAQLAEHIRQHIAASRLHGEGYRKLWARLRFAGVRTSPRRVRRVMRANGLSRHIALDAPKPSHTMGRSSPTRSMRCGEQT